MQRVRDEYDGTRDVVIGTSGRGDVGFYMRMPLTVDRRLRLAAAALHGGMIPRGALKVMVLELLTRGLDELERPRRKRSETGRGAKRSRPRKGQGLVNRDRAR